MKKGQMMELIQRLIHDAAVEQLKKKPVKRVSPHEPPDMSDDELDLVLFHGGMAHLNESFDETAKINASDITAFEQEMNDMVANIPNAVLTFDPQDNGYSIMLKNGGQTIDVVASGTIAFGNEGEMKWMFAIPNGFRVNTDGLEITQANRDLFANMANYYDSWQKDWRMKLRAPDGGASLETDKEQAPDSFRAQGAPAQGGAQPAPGGDGGQGGAPPMGI